MFNQHLQTYYHYHGVQGKLKMYSHLQFLQPNYVDITNTHKIVEEKGQHYILIQAIREESNI